MKTKRVIVSVTNDLTTDNRVRKVCEFLVSKGFLVTLVGRKLKTSADLATGLPYQTKRFRLWFSRGALFYANYNLRLFFFLLFHRADILVSNDLDTLLANHWAKKFKKNCRIIYDSHEYFTGVPELLSRPRVMKFWKRIEKQCVPKVFKMYTVNESIANLYRNEYNLPIDVVRNISDAIDLPSPKTREELGLPVDQRIIIFQGAGINIDRGAEELIEAMPQVVNCTLIFVGSGDVIEQLKERVRQLKLNGKVLFFGKRPYTQLMDFTRCADLGVSLDKDTNVNYRFSLPNKIFDYIQAGIPQMVSDLPEVKQIVTGYDVGIVCENHDPAYMAQKINALFSDKALYDRLKNNTSHAAAELNWEQEKKILEKIYL